MAGSQKGGNAPMLSTHMRRSLLVALLAMVVAVLPAASALAADPGKTFTFHNRVQSFIGTRPCFDAPYNVTTITNGVEHFQVRTLPDGTVVAQFTFTETGTYTASPVSGDLPSYTGRLTVRDGGIAFDPVIGPNGEIVSADKWVDTTTVSISGVGSDGSSFNEHLTAHINQNPLGSINTVFKVVCH
jgi:streptogramin lyase